MSDETAKEGGGGRGSGKIGPEPTTKSRRVYTKKGIVDASALNNSPLFDERFESNAATILL